ncbi:MAG: peptide chain release factor 1, partial [candidate division NC10 bacterium]|nr:peptide chain release factor 1 [candidate division NC10 bacterium]
QYRELGERLGDPRVIADHATYQKYAKAHAELAEIVEEYQQYRKVASAIEETKKLLQESYDPELRELAEAELKELSQRLEVEKQRMQRLLLPSDPLDQKNIILEIRAGTGGDEAALFASDLMRMYSRYAESKGWKVEILSINQTGVGGVKEAILSIEGRGVYSHLKFESGVHRVQRVPITEASGRIHTSAVTVAVLPEAEEVEVEIDPKDLRIDVFRSTGPGGQSVNTTDSAVRITHLPTGMVVSCQDEKSQHKNRAKAMKVLRARLLDRLRAEQEAQISAARRQQVGTGDRSERIRTYNFPQGRVTDHRIGLTLYSLDTILEGELDPLVKALGQHAQAEKLKAALC